MIFRYLIGKNASVSITEKVMIINFQTSHVSVYTCGKIWAAILEQLNLNNNKHAFKYRRISQLTITIQNIFDTPWYSCRDSTANHSSNDSFAEYFREKVNRLSGLTTIEPTVFLKACYIYLMYLTSQKYVEGKIWSRQILLQMTNSELLVCWSGGLTSKVVEAGIGE